MSDERQPVVRDPRVGQHAELLDWLASVDRILSSPATPPVDGSVASEGPPPPALGGPPRRVDPLSAAGLDPSDAAS